MANIIEQTFSHNIELEELSVKLTANTKKLNDKKDDISTPDIDYLAGYDYPMLQIKDEGMTERNIKNCEIDCYNKLPKIHTSLLVEHNNFLDSNIIKDKELLKIFIRSANPHKNNIRTDFYITNINKKSIENYVKIFIEGEINIPKLHSSINASYSGTSLDVLKQIAKELNLGFATNIQSTDDDMIWLATNQTYLEFINGIVTHAWIDDSSYVDWYIDVYYNLVFYEVNSTLVYEELETKAYQIALSYKEKSTKINDDLRFYDWQNVFSDREKMLSTDHGFINLKIINNTKLSKNGYHFNNIFLDYEDLEIINFDSEVITNTDNGVPLKGRLNDTTYADEKRIKYLGIQNDNMHNNYKYAFFHNYINNLELKKINLEINTTGINLNYIIGNNIYLQTTDARMQNLDNKEFEDTKNGQHPDQMMLTNNYQIHGIKFLYKYQKIYCQYLLTRREWPLDEKEQE